MATLGIALILAIGALVGSTAYAAGGSAVNLGTASSFAVLAGAGITNTGPTTILGDVGSYPTTTETGFGSVSLTGTNHGGDAVTQGAKTDLTTAYLDAAGRGPTIPVVADLGGLTLVPGVYNSATSLGLTGTLTLSGSSSDVWVFQAGSTLTTASGSKVAFIGGAQSCNVFWQVGSSATLGTGSAFKGTILALTSITATTGATVDGRLLARNGAVTLDTNVITRSMCAATPAPTSIPGPTSSPTPVPSAGIIVPAVTPAPAQTATPTPPVAVLPAQTLPSTSTLDGSTPFALAGIILVAIGALILRPRRSVPVDR